MLFRLKLVFIMVLLSFALPVYALAEKLDSPNIVVNLPSRTIALYSGESLVKEYSVAIGKAGTPTPLGNFRVVSKEINPDWYPPDKPGKIVLSGSGNPLGYRWIGFISNDYGIHGTNEPWSIGSAVSNGCLRMHETDVEELFDLVEYDTPVKITYDMIKIFIDEDGQFKLSIYPDVYGHGGLTAGYIRKHLSKYGLNAFVTDEYLTGAIAQNSKKPIDIARTVKLKINEKTLNGRGIIAQGKTYVPIKEVADSLGRNFSFDGQYASSALSGGKKISVVVSGDVLYASGEDIETLFGGRQSRQEESGFWHFEKITVFFNGNPTSLEVVKTNKIPAVPLKELAEVLNMPVRVDDAEAYLAITQINEYFDTFVYWNVQRNTIELIYPAP